jgi:hypothetical protein
MVLPTHCLANRPAPVRDLLSVEEASRIERPRFHVPGGSDPVADLSAVASKLACLKCPR